MDDARIAEIRGRLEKSEVLCGPGLFDDWPVTITLKEASADIRDLLAEVARLRGECSRIRQGVGDVHREADALRSLALRQHEMLASLEGVHFPVSKRDCTHVMTACPTCGYQDDDGHAKNCKHDALLSEGRKTLGVE